MRFTPPPSSFIFYLVLALSVIPFITTAAHTPRDKELSAGNGQLRVPRQLYRQTTREAIVMREHKRATRTGPAKRENSQMAYPTSTDPNYVSTGYVPWAVYRNTDANGASDRSVNNVDTREACHLLCEADSACMGTTHSTSVRTCYIIYALRPAPNAYKPQPGNLFLWSRRGVTCEQDAPNALSTSTCYTQYRRS